LTQWASKESSEIQFWQDSLRFAGDELSDYIKELSTKVTDTSKTDAFFFHFALSNLTERTWYQLKLAIVGYAQNPANRLKSGLEKYIYETLVESVRKYTVRFQKTKFFEFFNYTLGCIPYIEFWTTLRVVPEREWLGNYAAPTGRVLRSIFSLRWMTPRRLRKKTFRRGYDDKGTESSISDRARRQANTEEFPYLTKDFLESLRRHRDPIGLLRELGYLREKEE